MFRLGVKLLTLELKVKQRLAAGRMIRSLLDVKNYVIVVEHDLSVLDYLSDYICVLYGKPAIYGVVTLPYSVREGINIFLDGHIPTENLRFRDESLTFRISEGTDDFEVDKDRAFIYPKVRSLLTRSSLLFINLEEQNCLSGWLLFPSTFKYSRHISDHYLERT
jgi:translation initiation factor RLI1